MEQQEMREILNQVASGSLSTEDALLKLKMAPFEELDIATLDHHRGLRQGASEVIYGAGKTPEQIDIIHNAARILFQSGLNFMNGCEEVERKVLQSPERDRLVKFIRESKRGVSKQYGVK